MEKAIKIELDQLQKMGTWGLVDLPDERQAIGCYSWYGLPLYAYLIHWTGTFISLNSNLAMPLFSNGTPLFHIQYKHPCHYL